MPTGHTIAENACDDVEHEMELVPGTVNATRCRVCGYSSQTLTDDLGHDIR